MSGRAVRCDTCRFWRKDGTCHRYPPTIVSHIDGGVEQLWPFMAGSDPDDWCGEHQARED